uniref:Cement protein-52k n=1 Tax=Pollicipes pollicipes TaxID=41117 RepID=A0A290GLC7_POLPL|nr:cement protein-52k [Pollicipes pollicipes]
MIRTVLVVTLAAVAATYGHHHPGHGHGHGQTIALPSPYDSVLGGLLRPSDYNSAIQLAQRRYSNLPGLPAAYIIRYILSQQRLPIYRRTSYSGIPARPRRLAFLVAVFEVLPAPFYRGSYLSGLRSYLVKYKFPYWSSVNAPLALFDIRLAAQQLRPVSSDSFNNFFTRRVLGYNGQGFGAIPAAGSLNSLYNSLPLSSLPTVFRPISSSITAPTNSGAGILSVLSGIGVPRFNQPQASVGGLNGYLRDIHVPQRRFVSQIRGISPATIRRLIHPFVKRFAGGIRSDLLVLAVIGYSSLPQEIRRTVGFQAVFLAFFKLHGRNAPARLNSGYVSRYLSNFRRYCYRYRNPKFAGKH